MSVKNFRIDFHRDGYELDGVTRAKYPSGVNAGKDIIDIQPADGLGTYASSVALGNGIFLTASHLFDAVVTSTNPASNGATVRFLGYGMSVNGSGLGTATVKNLEGWNSKTAHDNLLSKNNQPNNDLAELKISVPVASTDVSSVIMFADQAAVTRVLTGKAVTNGGAATNNSGNFTKVLGPDRFGTDVTTTDRDSGGPGIVDIAGTQYTAGILSYGDNDKNTGAPLPSSTYSYLNPKSFYSIMNDVAKNGTQDFSKVAPDLIYGESDKDYIRGTVRKSDIILNGNSDIILAGGIGDVVNTGVGNHDVIFTAAANGGVDQGTTFILGPGNSTIVGGNANDRLAIPADRLWSKDKGLPTTAGLTTNSALVLLTGGTTNAPDAHINSWVGPHLPAGLYNSETPSTPAADNSSNPTDWLLDNDNYDYSVTYEPKTNAAGGVDLTIEVGASNPTVLYAPLLWRSSVVIKDYHTGDFGLKFTVDTSYADYENGIIPADQYYDQKSKAMSKFVSAPVASQYAVDDATTDWNGHNTFWAPENLSDATIKSDLAAVLNATQGTPGIATVASASRLAQAMSTFDTGSGVDTSRSISSAAFASSQMLAANSLSNGFAQDHHA